MIICGFDDGFIRNGCQRNELFGDNHIPIIRKGFGENKRLFEGLMTILKQRLAG